MPTRLLADLGGTNVRFALASGPGVALRELQTMECKEFASFDAAIAAYISALGIEPPQHACFAVAAVDTGDQVNITNNPWSFSRQRLQTHFGFKSLQVINDFTAVAFSLPRLQSVQLQELTQGLSADPDNALAVGPGTGLGGARLIAGERVIPCEPGHAGLSPGTALEMEIFRVLLAQRPEIHAELLVSGPGIERLHQTLAVIRDEPAPALSAAEISARALAGSDPLCGQVLQTFCALLGSVAGDFTLSCGAYGGVFLAGGIVPRVLPLLLHSEFLQRFIHKGAMAARLREVPVMVILDQNPGLLGAAAWPLPQ